MKNEAEIQNRVNTLLNDSVERMKNKVVKLLMSGAVNVSDYDPNTNGMILPKTILKALLEDEAENIAFISKKTAQKEADNFKLFI